MAVEFESFDIVQELIKGCLAEGVIVDWFLFNNHCIRLAPPLIITEAEIRLACKKLLKVIDKIYREGVKADVKRLSY